MKWPLNCFVCCCIYATYTDKYDSLLGLFVHKICKMMSNCNFLCQRRHLTLLYYYVVSEFVCVCEVIRWVHTFSIILLMHIYTLLVLAFIKKICVGGSKYACSTWLKRVCQKTVILHLSST